MAPSAQPHASIRIKGARQHNLKDLDVELPRNRLIVITGLSGSGKSSLAFDTLYAEGQRKYVESLSAYARQFLEQMQRPDVDYIDGLSPAIAIEQRSAATSPRSTIATTTEIYDYLRLLYASAGTPHDPKTGEAVRRQTPQQIADAIEGWGEGARVILLAPLVRNEVGEFRDVIEKARRDGFIRLRIDGEMVELDPQRPPRLAKEKRHHVEAVVDRLIIREGIRQRLTDSVEMGLKVGGNQLSALQLEDGEPSREEPFSTDFCNPRTGFTLGRLTPKHFSFNSHLGACPACHGIGLEDVFDPELMLDLGKSLDENAVRPWKSGGKRMGVYYAGLRESLARHYGVATDVPLRDLPPSFRDVLVHGTGGEEIEIRWGSPPKVTKTRKPFEGVLAMVERLYQSTESELTRNRLRAFLNHRTCSVCKGARLKPSILAVTIREASGRELSIRDFCRLSIREAYRVAQNFTLTDAQLTVAGEVLREIQQRLQFLLEVGLGYLNLDRESSTLSGGEAQRIRLATQIGSGLAGVLYVLDEPSIGLHQRDNERLVATLKHLRDLGNTVIVVEHDEDTIRSADYILDLGPGAGPLGGEIVAQGTLEEVLANERSLTARFLRGATRIPIPKRRLSAGGLMGTAGVRSEPWLVVKDAEENNLQRITARFPVGCLTCVTGVSGSGKSTLVNDILKRALFRDLYRAKDKPGKHGAILGQDHYDKAIEIDQSPIGRTPRSNPATYTGAFGPIRELFSQLPASRVRGYNAGRFSFNLKGGRCEACQGDGMIKIEMHFLADVYVECELCRGRRYNRETLEITYKGLNIADVLELSIDEAARFFRNVPQIHDKLSTLQDVGLGYLRLGQPGTTLSGGEAQRVKLSAELSKRSTGRTLYILDEPTTGLHFADIQKLLEVLTKLRDAGNTLIVIEHNLDVIKTADWILDLGPEGGEGGGRIISEGTPEQVAADPASVTGKYLEAVLKR